MRKNSILIACEVVAKELHARIGDELPVRVIDPALHVNPDRLRTTLQEAIDLVERDFETLVLGFGLCSRAVEGLRSKRSRIIIPLVDDCIGLFLGSRTAHLNQLKSAPGTFFLSRGWVEAGSTPFEEYGYMLKRFGQKRADRLMDLLLRNYTHLSYIHTDKSVDAGAHLDYARSKALAFGLEYNEIIGSTTLFDALINGLESPHLQVIEPGEEILYEMFMGENW